MRRLVLSLSALCLAAPATAAPGIDPAGPHELHVVLKFGTHRVLSPDWCDRFRLDLRDQLRSALGPLANVKVIDPSVVRPEDRPPLWRAIESGGLEAFDRPPTPPGKGPADPFADALRACGPLKTHFLFVNFRDGRYEVAGRQHDGFTGLASPLVRKAATSDREFVLRLAGLLVERDFGPSGTVGQPGKDGVSVRLKGGAKGAAGPWVAKGDVFAVSRVSRSRGGERGERVDECLLIVTREPGPDGECACRVVSRYLDPLRPGPATVAFRCLKLGTAVDEPLRLRVVNEAGVPQAGLQVKASDTPDAEGTLLPGRDGVFDSGTRTFSRAAFVRVYQGAWPASSVIPVELVDGRTATVKVAYSEGAEKLGDLFVNRRLLIGRMAETAEVLKVRNQEYIDLVRARKNAEAREQVIGTLALLEAATAGHADALAELAARNKELPADKQFDLKDAENWLGQLRNRRQALQDRVKDLDRVIAAEKDPARNEKRVKLQEAVNEAVALEGQDDFDKALEIYERVIADADRDKLDIANLDELKKKVAELREAWKVKGPAHAEARKFAFETWPGLMTQVEITANLDRAKGALGELKKAGDRLTVRRLARGCAELTARLNEAQKALPDEERTKEVLDRYAQTGEALLALTREALAFASTGADAPKK